MFVGCWLVVGSWWLVVSSSLTLSSDRRMKKRSLFITEDVKSDRAY
ncbi:MAG: hypothetical protein N2235_03770 [Fischerella sp.]|nr:hypothetical protein [Fischerella sp.]